MICKICANEVYDDNFAKHVKLHNIKIKEYYDKFIKKENEGFCLTCGKETNFYTLKIGYRKYCSLKCSANNKNTIVLRKKTKFEKYGDENFSNRNKAKNTCLVKYDCENVSQNDIVKHKKEEVCMIRYGVNNPYQIKHIKEKCIHNNKDKSYITDKTIKKYNELFDGKVISIKNNEITYYCNKCQNTQIMNKTLFSHRLYNNSTPCIICNKKHNCFSEKEKQLLVYVKKYYSGTIYENYRKIENISELDIYIPELNLAFEFNGTYWHADPRKYHENDVIGHKNQLAKEIWKKDNDKLLKCKENNINLIVIWELDFKNAEDLIKASIEISKKGLFSEIEVK